MRNRDAQKRGLQRLGGQANRCHAMGIDLGWGNDPFRDRFLPAVERLFHLTQQQLFCARVQFSKGRPV